jgi:hypothetical protein
MISPVRSVIIVGESMRINPVCEYCQKGFIVYIISRPEMGEGMYETQCSCCGAIVYMVPETREPTLGDML